MLQKIANKYLIPAQDKHFATLYYGSKQKFVPNINLSRYKDEAWLNINPKSVIVDKEKATIADEKIELTIGDAVHKFYEIDEKTFEYETVFLSRPAFDEIEFDLKFPEGLTAYKQFEISAEEINYLRQNPKRIAWTDEQIKQWARPDNVVGSYAFFWNKRNNQYTTGKFCHWYYPYLIDAAGKKTRIDDFVIDLQTKKAIYSLPVSWLDGAKYPIGLSGVKLGTEGVGSLSTDVYGGHVYAFGVGTASSGGVIDNIAMYTAATETGKLALYDEDADPDPNVLRDFTAEGEMAAGDWNIWGDTQVYTIVNGESYYVAIWIDANDIGVKYDGNTVDAYTHSKAYDGTFPNPMVPVLFKSGRNYSCYVEYTEAGVGVAPTGGLYGSLVGPFGGPMGPMGGRL